MDDIGHNRAAALTEHIQLAQVVLPCRDLAANLAFFTDELGFKVTLIFPADSPQVVVMSGYGLTLRLEAADADAPPITLRLLCDLASLPAGTAQGMTAPSGTRIELIEAKRPLEIPAGTHEFVLGRMEEHWGVGRAGMQYRDLIPSRLGGRFIASHIRIPDGGPVPDYVHFHHIRFQMIYCKAGWARLVYEDQGAPFLFKAGDCVLQPPEIRHRVLEASAGLEVIELGCPAVHETFADHAMTLPTPHVLPERHFGGQRFVRHIAADAKWLPWRADGFEMRDTGIAAATDGLAGARVVRPRGGAAIAKFGAHGGEFLFLFVLTGEVGLHVERHGDHSLRGNDSCVIPAGAVYALSAGAGSEILEVTLPAELPHT
ncbi:VOC family protein [Dongia deserti]|uniref:VOC family protein n=1 Tax=Dongia deserti TaxID=2268030 RepID=UPI000E65233E|nr:VOC family protein [Dongia deserti]